MNNTPREPQIDEKVKVQNNNKIFKIESVFFNTATLVESRRGPGEREKITVGVSELIYCEPEKVKTKRKQYKDAPPIKLTREQRVQILRNLVTEESIQKNFKREIMVLATLIRKFPHVEFLTEGFKPAIKANSVLYWINRPEVEQLYKLFSIDLTRKTETVKLEEEKVVGDLVTETVRKPKNLLDLLK